MIVRIGLMGLLPILGVGAADSCIPTFPPPTHEQVCGAQEGLTWRVVGFSLDGLEEAAPGELQLVRLARGQRADLRLTSRQDCGDWVTAVAWRVHDPGVIEVTAAGPQATVTAREVGQTPLVVEVTLRDGRKALAEIYASHPDGQARLVFGIRVTP